MSGFGGVVRNAREIFARRKWILIVPALAILGLSIVVAVLLPPTYRSTATVLIENPGITESLVQTSIPTFANQRLQLIAKRVLTTQNLIRIINDFGLYESDDGERQLPLLVEKIRKVILLQLVSTDVIDPKSGKAGQATIAFTLSFDHRRRKVAQRITTELVSLFVNESLREGRERSAEAVQFIEREAAKLLDAIEEMERGIGEFKSRNSNSLPDRLASNLWGMDRAQDEMRDLQSKLLSLQEKKILLESELEQVSPFSTFVVDGETVMSPNDRLRALKSRYVSLRAIYGPNHPDLVKARQAIETLELEVDGASDQGYLERRLATANMELTHLRERLGEAHPDIVDRRRQIEHLQRMIAENGKADSRLVARPDRATNPAYIDLKVKLRTTEVEIQMLRERQLAIADKQAEYEERVSRMPEVEREYLQLKREADAMLAKYQALADRKMQAEFAQAVELDHKSERYTVVEPPNLPIKPIRPNRLLIVAFGLIFSIAVGAGLAVLVDHMDPSVYGRQQLAEIIGEEPLVVVPRVRTGYDAAGSWRARAYSVFGFAVSIGLALSLVHYMIGPLGDILSIVLKRFGF